MGTRADQHSSVRNLTQWLVQARLLSGEAAEKAGLVIKKNFPVVRVAIYDSVTSENKIIDPAKA
jgi:hypothetical protein